MKNQILLLAGLLVFLGSCTIQKRVYRHGYTIDWKNNKMQTVKNEQDNESTVENDESVAYYTSENTSKQEVPLKIVDNYVTSSVNDEPVETRTEVQNEQIVAITETSIVNDAEESTNTTTAQKKAHSKKINFKKASVSPDDEEGNVGLKAIGWVFIIMGIIFVLVVSILIGILLMLLGLLFFVVGKKN